MAREDFIAKQWVSITGSRTLSGSTTWSSRLFNVYHHKGLYAAVYRTAETGTGVLDCKIQYYSKLSAAYHDLEGASFVQMPDGEAVPLERYLLVYPGLVAADADNAIALNTDDKHCGSYLPAQFKFLFTASGTTNVFAAGMWLLP